MSLIGALNIGQNAMAASQAALQVTGNNIANAGNPNYTRQISRLGTSGDQRFQQGMFIGTGVNLEAIERQIDEALQGRLRGAVSDSASGETQQQWMGQIESVFNALGDQNLSKQMSAFFSAWSSLANKPQDVGLRQVVLQSADSLAKWTSSLRNQLGNLQSDVNQQLQGQVNDADSMARQVADLNRQIITSEGANGGIANGLRDQRDAVIDKLSKLMDIKAVDQGNGAVNIYVGSEPLVSDTQSMGVGLRSDMVSGSIQSTVIFKSNNGEMNITSGQIGGLVGIRHNITDSISAMDKLAGNLIYEVNKLHASGQGTQGLSGVVSSNAVDDPAKALNSTDANLKFKPVNGSFVVHVRSKATGLESSTLVQVDLDGLGGNDTTLNSLAASLNGITGLTASVSGGKLNLNAASNSVDFSFSQDTSGTLASLGINVLFTGSNARDIGINQAIKDQPNLLAAAKNGQPADNQTALAISQLENTTLAGLNGLSLKDDYQSLIDTVAVSSASAKTNAQAAQAVQDTLQSQRESLSGVSLDEEAVNLMKQQRAFQAASRLISVVDEMMKTVIGLV